MRIVRSARLLIALGTTLLALPRAVHAHPMGNFSINHYSKIVAGARAIDLEYIVDMAEIPTFQELQESGLIPKTDDPRITPYLARKSESLKTKLTLEVEGRQLSLDTVSREVIFPPGAGGLPTMKMGFRYQARLQHPISGSPSSLHYSDGNFPDRAGWKEVIALGAEGTTLTSSSVPSRDLSSHLSNYPTDLLHSPPQVLVADLKFRTAPPIERSLAGSYAGVGADSPVAVRLQANRQATPRSAFTELIASNRTDTMFLLLAALIAGTLGAFHAFEPGHGKTLVAAYLVGSRGTARHAILLGSVVTASHTISVYVLGIITLYASQWIVPERLYAWLGIASGLVVASLGFLLFIRRYISQDAALAGGHHHDDPEHAGGIVHRHTWWGGHVHDHSIHSHDLEGHLDGHPHDHAHSHSAHFHDAEDHTHSTPERRASSAEPVTLRSLFLLGITGGIVPCPAALVVLLGALAIHRVAFGLFLIVAFSAGLAAVLVSFGLAIVYAGRVMSRFQTQGPLTQRWLPLTSAAVITVIGVSITIQSLIAAGVLHPAT